MGPSGGLRDGIRSPTPRILSLGGRDNVGRHIRRYMPLRRRVGPYIIWSNIRFESDGSGFEITFDKRKNAQLRQDNKVLVASPPLAAVSHVRLLRELLISTVGSEDLQVFRGLNGRLVDKSPHSTTSGPYKITYDQFLHFQSLWFSGVMIVSVAAFRKKFAT